MMMDAKNALATLITMDFFHFAPQNYYVVYLF